MATINPVSFYVEITGETTGDVVRGEFKVKPLLSSRDRLQKDEIRRSLLGDKPEAAGRDAMIRAEMFSHLSVSVVKAPDFWKDAAGGLDLFDDNVAIEIYEKTVDSQNEYLADLSKKGEAAKTKLRKKRGDAEKEVAAPEEKPADQA